MRPAIALLIAALVLAITPHASDTQAAPCKGSACPLLQVELPQRHTIAVDATYAIAKPAATAAKATAKVAAKATKAAATIGRAALRAPARAIVAIVKHKPVRSIAKRIAQHKPVRTAIKAAARTAGRCQAGRRAR